MTNELVEHENEAFKARGEGDFPTAISLYEKIVAKQPDWEHGQAFYDLAGCYEEIGDSGKAEENYHRPLDIQPTYYIFLSGYASFLSRFREPEKAFNAYLELLKVETETVPLSWTSENEQMVDDIKANLFSLGEKLGWKKESVKSRIANIQATGENHVDC